MFDKSSSTVKRRKEGSKRISSRLPKPSPFRNLSQVRKTLFGLGLKGMKNILATEYLLKKRVMTKAKKKGHGIADFAAKDEHHMRSIFNNFFFNSVT
mmetsp:Transcript_5402/g.6172  ORF Transcript_5402/g.6172 Transcript_5402/m.6172 type:complete len:97 (+) Transcript_5402:305-595(+)